MNQLSIEGTHVAQVAETKERILDTAERLFAERGVEATSIRDITGAAEANLGSINYHFGTKQELVAAVFNRRLGPLTERRLVLLDEIARKAGDKSTTLEAILEVMIRPMIVGSFVDGKKNASFMRLMARCHSEPNAEVKRLVRAQFQKLMSRFSAAYLNALPGLTHDELSWQLRFVFGALHHTVLTLSQEGPAPVRLRKKLNEGELVQRLVAFAAAGMRASIA
jgi:AcrR family transcriptional regulator